MSAQKTGFIDEALVRQKEEGRLRGLTAYEPEETVLVGHGGRQLVNFSGNDYLGLSKDPRLIKRSRQYAKTYGAGAAASRLITGTFSIHETLERQLSDVFGREAALLFNSGFQANSTIIGSLADRRSVILADKLSHNSLLQGSLLSRAAFRRFEHNSVTDLEAKLQRAFSENFSRILVITESLFSMDGDRSDLDSVARLCKKYNALLLVDDAHAIGVWGTDGLGFAREVEGVDMVIGTCGKAFGSFGAFVLCSAKMRDYLVNFCPGFIYTTALPPAVIGATQAALEIIPRIDNEREKLFQNIKRMKEGIQKAGFSTGPSDTQIIPIMTRSNEKTMALSAFLKDKGFLATAIRPPTVSEGGARIRIALSAAHSEKQIDEFLKALRNFQYD